MDMPMYTASEGRAFASATLSLDERTESERLRVCHPFVECRERQAIEQIRRVDRMALVAQPIRERANSGR